MVRGLTIIGALLLAALAAAQPPDRGPLHPPDDAAGRAVEPNPYFYSELLRYVEDKLPIQGPNANAFEAQCYEQMFLHARRLPADLLRRASTNRINFAHMFNEDRARYRGALVRIEGRLKLLRQFEPPETLKGLDEGLTKQYEGWIFVEEFGGNPYCVVFSDLPRGLEPSETIDRQVETDGFFFKRYRYAAKDGWRDAPLLIAREIRLTATPTARSAGSIWDVPAASLAGVIGAIAATVAVGAGTVWWFRREDRKTRERLTQVHARMDEWPGDAGE